MCRPREERGMTTRQFDQVGAEPLTCDAPGPVRTKCSILTTHDVSGRDIRKPIQRKGFLVVARRFGTKSFDRRPRGLLVAIAVQDGLREVFVNPAGASSGV